MQTAAPRRTLLRTVYGPRHRRRQRRPEPGGDVSPNRRRSVEAGRGDQGHRTRRRRHHARDRHPPRPNVHHAVRPRGHPRAGVAAGRHRRPDRQHRPAGPHLPDRRGARGRACCCATRSIAPPLRCSSPWRRSRTGRPPRSSRRAGRSSASRKRATRCTTSGSAGSSRITTTPLSVIKWKELYDTLEKTLDSAEDAANVLESVTIKHG